MILKYSNKFEINPFLKSQSNRKYIEPFTFGTTIAFLRQSIIAKIVIKRLKIYLK